MSKDDGGPKWTEIDYRVEAYSSADGLILGKVNGAFSEWRAFVGDRKIGEFISRANAKTAVERNFQLDAMLAARTKGPSND